MRSIIALYWICAAALTASGCSSQIIRIQEGPLAENDPNYEETQDYFLFGLFPSPQQVDAIKICGEKRMPEKVESMQTPTDAALNIVTLGIYAPRTVRVYCRDRPPPPVVKAGECPVVEGEGDKSTKALWR